MDKFEQKEMQKKRPTKNTWYICLINYIPEPIRKIISGLKDIFVSVFETNTPKDKSKKLCYGQRRNQANQERKINLKK